MPEYTCYYKSPLGELAISGSPEGISAICFAQDCQLISSACTPLEAGAPVAQCFAFTGTRHRATCATHHLIMVCIEELNRYFAGTLTEFTVKFQLSGTEFQKKVWNAVQSIPYGSITTYKEIAQAVGSANAFRAVGNANHRNPLPLIIPCHRVIGSNRGLIGYAGGLWRKEWLLAHELHWVNRGLWLGSEQDRKPSS